MEDFSFSAFVVNRDADGVLDYSIKSKQISDLPKGDVLIDVHYSTFNYKDYLSCMGNHGVTRKFPHVPGIDAAGVVAKSSTKLFNVGDNVMVMSREMGMTYPGGFSQYISVPERWVQKVPAEMSLRDCMSIGTAGLTSAIAIETLLVNGIHPTMGEVIVTGASGGVGIIAVDILSNLGFEVVASSGKIDAYELLYKVGARRIIGRDELIDVQNRNMLKQTWSGSIDAVGGETLAGVIKSLKSGGVVAACGNTGSSMLNVSLLPFILRGISVVGVNAEGKNNEYRDKMWRKLADKWRPPSLSFISNEINMREIGSLLQAVSDGNHFGRTIINVKG